MVLLFFIIVMAVTCSEIHTSFYHGKAISVLIKYSQSISLKQIASDVGLHYHHIIKAL